MRTAPADEHREHPYDAGFIDGAFLRCRYRGTGPNHRDNPEALTFIVAIDDQVGAPAAWQFNDPAALTARRQYVTAVVRQRLHLFRRAS